MRGLGRIESIPTALAGALEGSLGDYRCQVYNLSDVCYLEMRAAAIGGAVSGVMFALVILIIVIIIVVCVRKQKRKNIAYMTAQ